MNYIEGDGAPSDIAIGDIWAQLMAIKMAWVAWRKSFAWLEMYLTARSTDVLPTSWDKNTRIPFWLHIFGVSSDLGLFSLV